MAKRAAIYIRVSSLRQVEEGTSLESQEQDLAKFAAQQKYELAGVYRDEGLSGADRDRPGLAKAVEDAENGAFDVLMVSDITRLGRSAAHNLSVAEALKDHNVEIQDLKGRSSTDELTFNILSAIAQYEHSQIRERTVRGMEARAAQGKWSGGVPPFGTTTMPAPDGEGTVLVENAAQAAAIREAVSQIVDDRMSTGEAAKWMNDDAEMATIRGAKWTARNLLRLLRSPRLKGEFYWRDFPVEHPAIIDEVTWDRLQKALDRYARGAHVRGRYPLSLRIDCPCGAHWVGAGRATNRARMYRCQRNVASLGDARCSFTEMRYINANKLENHVWDHLVGIVSDPKLLQEALRQADDTPRQSEPALRKKLQKLDKTIAKLKAEEVAIVRLMAVDTAPMASINSAIAQVQEEIADAERRQKEISVEIAKVTTREHSVEDIVEWLSDGTVWAEIDDIELRQDLMDALNVRVALRARDHYDITVSLPQ